MTSAARKPRVAAKPRSGPRPMLVPTGDDVLVVDLEQLTISQIEEIEDVSGQPITTLYNPDKPQGRISRAVAYVLSKKDDPSFTLEQAGDKRLFLKVNEVPPTSESA